MMRPLFRVILGLAFSTIGVQTSAQIPDAPQPAFANSMISENTLEGHASVTPAIGSEPAATPVETGSLVQSTPAPPRRVADSKFFLWNGIHLGMAVFDIEMTQRCIAAHHCKEANPMLPSSQTGQLTVNFAIVAYTSGMSYWLKKNQSGYWWLPPAAGTAVHSVGLASGFEHQ